ncbi:hypothetical protein ACWCHM_30020 [Micromonospora sp. SCSIO 07396]
MTVRYRLGLVTSTGTRVRSQPARTVPSSVSSRRVSSRQTVLPDRHSCGEPEPLLSLFVQVVQPIVGVRPGVQS